MTTDQHNDPLLTVTDIAREAGVRSSAVSNWRKRYTDFPRPAATSDSGKEIFRLSEVNAWLRSTHREEIRLDLSESLWQYLRTGRAGLADDATALEATFAALVLRQRLDAAGQARNLTGALAFTADSRHALRNLLERAALAAYEPAFAALLPVADDAPDLLRVVDSVDPSETTVVMEALLQRWIEAAGMRGPGTTTSATLAELIARIAPRADTVLDPAIGFGSIVVAIVNRLAAEGAAYPEILGQEKQGAAWAIVVLRLLAHGVDFFHVRRGDSLLDDADPDRRVDLIVADPPYNQRAWGAERLLVGDPRWRYATPTDRDANAAWIQHVVHHLAPNGHAIVVVPPGVLFSGGRTAALRRSLVAAGILEGVIALPAGLVTGTGIPVAMLLLRGPADGSSAAAPVLFVNASSDEQLAPRTRHTRILASEAIDRIAATVAAFREAPEAFDTRSGFATTIGTHVLLGDGSVGLNPPQWIEPEIAEAEDFANEFANALDAIVRGLSAVRHAPEPLALTIDQPDQPVPGLHLREVALTDAVEILRPGRLDKGDYTTEGTPVLTQSALNRDSSPPDFQRYVDLETLPGRHVITQPGDVILATIGERPYAVVDRHGGAVLGNDLEVLRIHVDWLDPDVVAACLSSSQTARAVTGATIPRVRLRDLTLPAMSAETTAAVRETLRRLREIEAAAHDLASAAARARGLLVEAAVAGNKIQDRGD
jgi:hypothetical protein